MIAATGGRSEITFRSAFESETELQQYGPNALSLFALSLYLRIEDVHEFAADAITEGPDDKKVDICYVDQQEGRAIIAQSYFAETWGKRAAPARKASELNTAIGWLLSVDEDRLPSQLRTKAVEIRRALVEGSIRAIEVLFIHNCHESSNVESELKTVADTAHRLAESLAGERGFQVVSSYREMGIESIEELYRSRDSDILIDDWLDVPVSGYVEEQSPEWRALLATIPGDWIQSLYAHHRDRLFSANYRDYLGYTKRKGNINYEIAQTAESEPVNFLVYNNGITALTRELHVLPTVRIRGISIINGAQTTGALSEVSQRSAAAAKVLIRFVECNSPALIDKIIRYNNTQNEIRPADRRSSDSVQKHLRDTFSSLGITYVHRRTAARIPRTAITAESLAPALCAFHGDPQTAYRSAKEIFNDDTIYARVFPSRIRAEHVFMVRNLSMAIDALKTELKTKVADQTATSLEKQQYEVLKYSGSKHFLFYIIGALAEEIMHRRVSDLFEWKCKQTVLAPGNKSVQKAWMAALRTLLPHIATIVTQQGGSDPFYDVPRSKALSLKAAQGLKALIASLESSIGKQFTEIRRKTEV